MAGAMEGGFGIRARLHPYPRVALALAPDFPYSPSLSNAIALAPATQATEKVVVKMRAHLHESRDEFRPGMNFVFR